MWDLNSIQQNDERASVGRKRCVKPDAEDCLIDAALDTQNLSQFVQLGSETTLAVVITLPSPSWVGPVEDRLRERFGSDWTIIARDGSNRAKHRSDRERDEVARLLAHGVCVLGIAAAVQLLPSNLVGCADATIDVPPFKTPALTQAIRHFTGEPFEAPQELDLAGLDLYDLMSAFRVDSSGDQIFQRIRSMARRRSSQVRENVPDLEHAIEFGEARSWGLDLARDFEDYRAGALDWSELGAAVVVHGEPGLGKTLWARSLAKRLEIPLLATSIADLFANTAGNLDSVVKGAREIFARAEAMAPCVLFLDELDALPRRDKLDGRTSSWWTPVITDFLLLLDSAVAAGREGVVVIGATNYLDRVDPALLRPGRLDHSIEMTRPNAAGVQNILRYHLRDELGAVDLAEIGELAEGATAADVMQSVRTARRFARRSRRPLSLSDVRNAILPQQAVSPDELERTALHEAGHIIVCLALGCGRIRRAVIGGKQTARGSTSIELRNISPTVSQIEDRVTMVMAGRAAEFAVLGSIAAGSGGAEDSDLAIATRQITAVHASEGLRETTTYLGGDTAAKELLLRDQVLRRAVESDLRRLQDRAIEIVKQHRSAVTNIATALAARRHLSAAYIERAFRAQDERNQDEQERPC